MTEILAESLAEITHAVRAFVESSLIQMASMQPVELTKVQRSQDEASGVTMH